MIACPIANKDGKPIVAFAGNDQFPTAFFAKRAQIIYVLALKGFVIFPGVTLGRKFVVEIFLKFV